jgi:hypothetical protein
MDMIAQHLHDEAPSARAVDPNVSAEVDALLSAMLDKDASARPSLARVREVLGNARDAKPAATPAVEPAPSGASSHLWKWALGGLAVAGVGAAVVLGMNGKPGPSSATPRPAPSVIAQAIDAGVAALTSDAEVPSIAAQATTVDASAPPVADEPPPRTSKPKQPKPTRQPRPTKPQPPAATPDAGVKKPPPRPADDPESLVNPFPGRTR